MLRFTTTVFVSAFLLFQVQPLISRYILPWFGGSPGVWSVALLFFQGGLLAGYAWAHLSASRFKPRVQAWVHVALLGAACVLLPIIPPESLKPDGGESPEWRILLLLAVTVGLPYFVVSATGPLVQVWFSRSHPGRSPYPLYAVSNAGSLLALVTYPFVVERFWGRDTQAWIWSAGFALFAALCAWTCLSVRRGPSPAQSTIVKEPEPDAERRRHPALWIGFAAAGTTMLLACTNQLCLDVASVPFLWVLPLALYLLSFIITFAGERFYSRPLFIVLLVGAVDAVVIALWYESTLSLSAAVIVYASTVFIFSMVCHGEVFRLRPRARDLTRFYLCLAIGGVMGGAFVALAAPLLFPVYLELPIGMVATATLMLFAMRGEPGSWFYRGRSSGPWVLAVCSIAMFAAGLGYVEYLKLHGTTRAERNFHGVFRVTETTSHGLRIRTLISGNTTHGWQILEPGREREPTSYYGPQSGAALALGSLPDDEARNIGVIGLGTGSMAAWARPGDHFKFYEINADSLRIAREDFTFLEDCRGRHEVVIGDARLKLEAERPNGYDVLVVDAFTSDAIPVHLLTREALALYHSHVREGGAVCFHVSNRHLDVGPVVASAARELGLECFGWASGGNTRTGTIEAEWLVVTDSRAFEEAFVATADDFAAREQSGGRSGHYEPRVGTRTHPDADKDFRTWTDDYTNLFAILK